VKPVLILQHLSSDGPAYLGTWLAEQGVPCELRNSDAGQEFPADLGGYGALAILGGEMSANDPLPSLRQAETLIRQALRDGIPTFGHCLGGQLMARALGARVVDSPAPEIGWQPMDVLDTPAARAWFGRSGRYHVFQWHHEAFELPADAVRLAGSAACPNQAFALGPHLALQFHVEIDSAKLLAWTLDLDARYRDARAHQSGGVQDPVAMRADASVHLAAHQALARRLYERWLATAAARA
jgi:GMP synthase (glutamine-hydrolysing)